MKRILAVLATMALMVAIMAMPASAQPNFGPIFGGQLVSVNVSGNTVQLPISVAANVCDVDVAALAQEIDQSGSAQCDARADSRAFN